MTGSPYDIRPIGWIESALVDMESAPKQGDEGAPEAWLVIDGAVQDGARDLEVGAEVILLTWLDRARRDVLIVHPRGDRANPERGVFSTRSPHRPNPVGLHTVQITAIEGNRIRVRDLEALDGTPIIDIKPILEPKGQR